MLSPFICMPEHWYNLELTRERCILPLRSFLTMLANQVGYSGNTGHIVWGASLSQGIYGRWEETKEPWRKPKDMGRTCETSHRHQSELRIKPRTRELLHYPLHHRATPVPWIYMFGLSKCGEQAGEQVQWKQASVEAPPEAHHLFMWLYSGLIML